MICVHRKKLPSAPRGVAGWYGGYDEGAAAKEPMQLFTKNIGLC
jgi:hypothetical protein